MGPLEFMFSLDIQLLLAQYENELELQGLKLSYLFSDIDITSNCQIMMP